ncbi:dienelactone hydrolase family protein [Paucibacter sp. PLA-PC-4]|uniref:dienelactone hydrolase family protein n=1 Tax=Paucibacter sp. PLA-PC-4 TaxID=2993655 RepID=UPI0022494EEE|nr:alpha/beta hydrolase family protein [Paucibacter sp. PLA-PC-4]MCX2860919.1 dienelactone hydrolase family protein [Paucibacter sp. PLA-PC-4]
MSVLLLMGTSAVQAQHQTLGLDPAEPSLPVFHDRLRRQLSFDLGWTAAAAADPGVWRAAGLAKARELMLPPQQDPTPFAPAVIDEIDRGSYVARKIEFNVTAESRVLGLLLVPKGAGPFPAALLLHDHGARFDIGKEKLIRPWGQPDREAAARDWVDKYFSGRFLGDELARRGHTVLAVDALGWGDRSAPGFARDSQQALASNLLNLGTSFAGLIAHEDLRAAQFLAGRPEVDRRRVAAIGFSMGAFRAWQVAALSDDISAGIAVNWMATLQGLMVPGGNQLKGQSSFAMLHPFVARHLDYPDIAALAAPKPMLFYAGAQDGLFPLASAQEAFAKLRQVWAAHGAGYRLHTSVWPLGHVFSAAQQQAAFDWLDASYDGRSATP